jgi:hypothetical protein
MRAMMRHFGRNVFHTSDVWTNKSVGIADANGSFAFKKMYSVDAWRTRREQSSIGRYLPRLLQSNGVYQVPAAHIEHGLLIFQGRNNYTRWLQWRHSAFFWLVPPSSNAMAKTINGSGSRDDQLHARMCTTMEVIDKRSPIETQRNISKAIIASADAADITHAYATVHERLSVLVHMERPDTTFPGTR